MRVAITIALLILSSPAAAERAVVLPVGGDPQLAQLAAQAEVALIAALEAHHIEAIVHEAGHKPCDTTACAPELLRGYRADTVVGCALRVGEGSTVAVHVLLIDRAGARFPGDALATQLAVPGVVDTVLREARGLQLLGPGPWVSVTTAPADAQITIDGAPRGVAPYLGRIDPGKHRIAVTAAAHLTKTIELEMPDAPTHHEKIDVDLTAANGAQEEAAPLELVDVLSDQPPRSTPVNTTIGLGLTAAAVVLVSIGVAQLLTDGDCESRDDTGQCTQRVEHPAAVPLIIAGGASAVGAGVFLAFTPLEF